MYIDYETEKPIRDSSLKYFDSICQKGRVAN